MSEPNIDSALVKALIAAQFPQWANLCIAPVVKSGWDNRTFHLGDTMSVRLPSASGYAAQVNKEQRWLPKLAPHLPLPIPQPIAMGQPGAGYPFAWSIMAWLPGETADALPDMDLAVLARDLATFLNALRAAPVNDGPNPGAHNFYRGGDLRIYDQEVRHCLDQLGNKINHSRIMQLWTRACHSAWGDAPVWVHGDVAPGNLLCNENRLSALIDFGCCGVGDPACDLTMAWTVFEGESRSVFKDTLALNQDTWDRAAGWALWKALLNACKGKPGGFETLKVICEDGV